MIDPEVSVVREIRIAAPPEVVFRFLTDPERHSRWMGVRAQLDPQPGGVHRVEYAGGAVARGEFLEVSPPHRVVFTWGWEGDEATIRPGASRVEIDLSPDGTGTLLRLVHSGLVDATETEGHRKGWDQFLPELAREAAAG